MSRLNKLTERWNRLKKYWNGRADGRTDGDRKRAGGKRRDKGECFVFWVHFKIHLFSVYAFLGSRASDVMTQNREVRDLESFWENEREKTGIH